MPFFEKNYSYDPIQGINSSEVAQKKNKNKKWKKVTRRLILLAKSKYPNGKIYSPSGIECPIRQVSHAAKNSVCSERRDLIVSFCTS